MVPLLQAKALALASVPPTPITKVDLRDALGRYLAESIFASRAAPACDNSAMDGFAVQSQDTDGAKRDRPAMLKVVGTLYAGVPVPERDLGRREAYRVFTGAPIPYGADAVVRMEACRDDKSAVAIFVDASPGENVRQRGEEYDEGALLFSAGHRIDAHVIGVLASLGMARVPVRARPRVAVVTIGDELVAAGRPALPHQAYDCNGPLLAALVEQAGGQVIAERRMPDQDDKLRAELERLWGSIDVLVTTGGASIGARDRVKHVLRALGMTTGFDGVAMKPGKPVAAGLIGQVPVTVLPGNPGAAVVTFDQFTRPILLKLQGVIENRRRQRARLDGPRRKQHALTYLLSGHVVSRGPEFWTRIPPQGSGQILQNVGADGWVVLPEGKSEFVAGDEVEVELFDKAQYHPVPPRDISEDSTR